MAEATSSAQAVEMESGKSEPLVLLMSGSAALLWGLLVYGLLVKVPEYSMGFLGREEHIPITARWLVAMSEPWIVLLLTLGIFALILGSFHYKNKPLGMIMLLMGAVSVWWSLSTLEEAKEIAVSAPDRQMGPAPMGLSGLESKLGTQSTPAPTPPPTPPAPKTSAPPAPPAPAPVPPPAPKAEAPVAPPQPPAPPPPPLLKAPNK